MADRCGKCAWRGSEIGRGRDGRGNELSGSKRRQFERLRRQHTRAQFETKTDRNLDHGCSEVRRITSALGLGESVREQACGLFRTAQSEDLLRGRSIDAMAAASVYAACRCLGVVRPIEEVGAITPIGVGRVQNSYDVLNVELGLAALVQRPTDMVPWVADQCDAPDEVQHRGLELAEVAEERGIANGARPSGVAAACLHRAADKTGWSITQKAVADAANVSPVTVRTQADALTRAQAD